MLPWKSRDAISRVMLLWVLLHMTSAAFWPFNDTPNEVQQVCPPGRWLCPGPEHRCIYENWLCDGVNDCGNNEDELVCGQMTATTTNQILTVKQTTPNPTTQKSTTANPTTQKSTTEKSTTKKTEPATEVTTESTDLPATEEETRRKLITTPYTTVPEVTPQNRETSEMVTSAEATDEAKTSEFTTHGRETSEFATQKTEQETTAEKTTEITTRVRETSEFVTTGGNTERRTSEQATTKQATTKQAKTEQETTEQETTEQRKTEQAKTEQDEETTQPPTTKQATTEQETTERRKTEQAKTEQDEETTQRAKVEPATTEQATTERAKSDEGITERNNSTNGDVTTEEETDEKETLEYPTYSPPARGETTGYVSTESHFISTNFQIYNWENWSNCSALCGGGVQTRRRVCSGECKTGHEITEKRVCNIKPCPSHDCASGVKTFRCSDYSQKCINYKRVCDGIADCPGLSDESSCFSSHHVSVHPAFQVAKEGSSAAFSVILYDHSKSEVADIMWEHEENGAAFPVSESTVLSGSYRLNKNSFRLEIFNLTRSMSSFFDVTVVFKDGVKRSARVSLKVISEEETNKVTKHYADNSLTTQPGVITTKPKDTNSTTYKKHYAESDDEGSSPETCELERKCASGRVDEHCIRCICGSRVLFIYITSKKQDKVSGATVFIAPHGESIIGESNRDGWVMLTGLCKEDSDLIIHKSGYEDYFLYGDKEAVPTGYSATVINLKERQEYITAPRTPSELWRGVFQVESMTYDAALRSPYSLEYQALYQMFVQLLSKVYRGHKVKVRDVYFADPKTYRFKVKVRGENYAHQERGLIVKFQMIVIPGEDPAVLENVLLNMVHSGKLNEAVLVARDFYRWFKVHEDPNFKTEGANHYTKEKQFMTEDNDKKCINIWGDDNCHWFAKQDVPMFLKWCQDVEISNKKCQKLCGNCVSEYTTEQPTTVPIELTDEKIGYNPSKETTKPSVELTTETTEREVTENDSFSQTTRSFTNEGRTRFIITDKTVTSEAQTKKPVSQTEGTTRSYTNENGTRFVITEGTHFTKTDNTTERVETNDPVTSKLYDYTSQVTEEIELSVANATSPIDSYTITDEETSKMITTIPRTEENREKSDPSVALTTKQRMKETTENVLTDELTSEKKSTHSFNERETTKNPKVPTSPTTKIATPKRLATEESYTERQTTERQEIDLETTKRASTKQPIKITTQSVTEEPTNNHEPTTERLTTKIPTTKETTRKTATEKATTPKETTRKTTTEKATTPKDPKAEKEVSAAEEKVTTSDFTTQPTSTPLKGSCQDMNANCGVWAERGYCYNDYLIENCKLSCNLCPDESAASGNRKTDDLTSTATSETEAGQNNPAEDTNEKGENKEDIATTSEATTGEEHDSFTELKPTTNSTPANSCKLKCEKGQIPNSACTSCQCVAKQYAFLVQDYTNNPLQNTVIYKVKDVENTGGDTEVNRSANSKTEIGRTDNSGRVSLVLFEMCSQTLVVENHPIYVTKSVVFKPKKSDAKMTHTLKLETNSKTICPVTTHDTCNSEESECDRDWDCRAINGKCCISNCKYVCIKPDKLFYNS